jgi:hypothetical protein
MIIISSPKAVRDLLDKRGAITGGRPRSHMQIAHGGLHMVLEDMGMLFFSPGAFASLMDIHM